GAALGETTPLQLAQKPAQPEPVHRRPAPAPAVVAVAELDERVEIAPVGLHGVGAGSLLLLEMKEIIRHLGWLIGGPRAPGGHRAAFHRRSSAIHEWKSRSARSANRLFFASFLTLPGN